MAGFTRYIPAIAAWVLTLGLSAVFFAFPCRDLLDEIGVGHLIYDGILFLIVISNFIMATVVDPGKYPRASEDESVDDQRAPLHKNTDINGVCVRMKWCSTCQFYRPPRCSHCSVCDYCIDTFDHHCPWVNNCIGARNYRYFFVYLIALALHMLTVLVLSVLALYFTSANGEGFLRPTPIITIIVIAADFMLLIPVITLLVFHIFLVSKGRTTNEQVTGKFKGGVNPFSKSCNLNWLNAFCGPTFPRLVGRKPETVLLENVLLVKEPGSASLEQVQVFTEVAPNRNGSTAGKAHLYTKLQRGSAIDDNRSIASSIVSELRISKLPTRTSSMNNLLPEDQLSQMESSSLYIQTESGADPSATSKRGSTEIVNGHTSADGESQSLSTTEAVNSAAQPDDSAATDVDRLTDSYEVSL